MKRRANIIFEKVLTEINDWNLPLFTEARKNGYEIECVAMGVHRLQSVAGMYYRREKEYLDDPAHLLIPIPKEKHDLCYEKLPFILKKMETCKTVDIISIYNRDLTFKWSKDLKKDEVKQNISSHQLSLIDALNFSRQSFKNNPMQIQITYNHLETARLLMQQRNSETLKIQVVDDIKKELTDFLEKDSQPNINNKGNEK